MSHFSYMLKQVCWILPLTLPFFPWTTDNCSRSVFFLLIFFYEYAKAPLSIRSDRRLQKTVQSLDTHVNKSLREVKGIPHAHWFRLLYIQVRSSVLHTNNHCITDTNDVSTSQLCTYFLTVSKLEYSPFQHGLSNALFSRFSTVFISEFKKLHTSDWAKYYLLKCFQAMIIIYLKVQYRLDQKHSWLMQWRFWVMTAIYSYL